MEVTLDNVSPRYVDNFAKINKSIADTRGFAYDYSSIMHYSERTFTNNGLKTIKAWYLHFSLYKCSWVFFKVGLQIFFSLRGDIIISFFNILKQSEIWWIIIVLFDLELYCISTVNQNASEFLLLTSIVVIEVNEVRKYLKAQPQLIRHLMFPYRLLG